MTGITFEAFSYRIRNSVSDNNPRRCCVCHGLLPPDAYWEGHAPNGIHYELVMTNEGPMYQITDAPERYAEFIGNLLSPAALSLDPTSQNSNMRIMCKGCHIETHNMAWQEYRLRMKRLGLKVPNDHTVPPLLLAEVTDYVTEYGI